MQIKDLKKAIRCYSEGCGQLWARCSSSEATPPASVSAPTSPQSRIFFVLFNCLNLYHKSPDSGERQCKSTTWKGRFDPTLRAVGATMAGALRSVLSRDKKIPVWTNQRPLKSRRDGLAAASFDTASGMSPTFYLSLSPSLIKQVTAVSLSQATLRCKC